MKPTLVILSILLLASCSVVPKPPTCTETKVKSDSVVITGKSGSDNAQAGGVVIGMHLGLALCMLGPIGCVAGIAMGTSGGLAAGSVVDATDYQVTASGKTYSCQKESCEDAITGKPAKFDGEYVTITSCVNQ